MALQVWLPLTKDLRNQGLSNVTITNNGATFNSAGKLGGCYSFGTGDSYITVDSTPLKAFTEFSFACWVKIISWNTSYSTVFAAKNGTNVSWNNLIFSLLRNSSNSTLCFNISNGSSSTTTNCQTGALSLNTWYHITCTYKSGEIKLYQDGDVVSTFKTTVVPNFNSIVNLWIGKSNANSYQSNNLLNDVRIYDHCLSPMEVKKLSQGLVLHYPLNRNGWGQENLVHNSNQFRVGGHATGVTPSVEEDGTYKVIAESGNSNYSSSWWKEMTGIEDEFVEGESFTVSFWIKSSNANKTNPPTIYLKSGMGYYSMKGKVSANYSQVYYTGTWKKTNSLSPHLGWSGLVGTYYICQWKIEKGTIPTPWCPNSSDALATTMGLNSTTEYDCSGYCNNGEYYAYDANGSISYTSDTPKYNVSTHIASANPTQNAASGTRYLYGHCELTNPTQMSVAFWLKPITGGYGGTTSNGQGYFCTTNYEYGNISVGSDYQASAMNHRDGAVNMNDSASTTQCKVTFYPTIGKWHHYVYTYDGQVGRGYKDGVQTATAQFSAAKTLDSFIGVVIGFSKAGGAWRRNDACYSDFRIYATALSASDVKSLYQNCATIDPDGTIHGQIRS